jgi:hypothetical protein
MSLRKLLALAEDGPWCGTKPPGIHPPHLLGELAARPITGAGPTPERWHDGGYGNDREAFFWQAIQLRQIGQRLEQMKGGVSDLGAQVSSSADAFFDDWCGTVPWSVLIQWLLHHPPPPPPWLEQVSFAAVVLELATKAGGESGKNLGGAASGLIAAGLPQSSAR